jgi:hypothetical protein
MWQALCILAPGVLPERSESICAAAWQSWHLQPQRTIRDLISLFIALLLSRIPSQIDPHLLDNLNSPQGSTEEQLFLSLATCGSVLCFTNLPQQYNDQVKKIVRKVIPFLTAHLSSVRGTAQDILRAAMTRNGENLKTRFVFLEYHRIRVPNLPSYTIYL